LVFSLSGSLRYITVACGESNKRIVPLFRAVFMFMFGPVPAAMPVGTWFFNPTLLELKLVINVVVVPSYWDLDAKK